MELTKHIIYCMLFVASIFLFCPPYQSQTKASEKRPAQIICSDCNSKDEKGRKIGLWIENNGLREVYYKNGKREGIYKSYDSDSGKLESLGEYKNGTPAGIWYYFDRESHLILIEKEVSKNTGLMVTRDDGKKVAPAFKAYVVGYYHNGVIKEEGLALYDQSVEIHFFKKGTWKYYDESGKLIKTEKHD